MPDTSHERDSRELMRRIETLLQEIEQLKEPRALARSRELVKCLLDLHGSALERLLERIAASNKSGIALIDELAEDDLVAGLMLLYGLHPLDMESRVQQALEKVKPYLHSHGGNVELLGVDNGIVRLRLHGSCHGCPSSAMTLKNSIEEAIVEKAPDVVSIRVEGETAQEITEPAQPHGFALPILSR
jgi:Fe-S cluster biogenesis protein NfuA